MFKLDELISAAERLRIIIEGYADLLRLNLADDTRRLVNAHKERSQLRLDLIGAAVKCLTNLVADGYPELPCKEVPGQVLVDMQENISGIQLAIGEFCESITTAGIFTIGPEAPI